MANANVKANSKVDVDNTDSWDDVQTGFPPYFKVEEGKEFVARVVSYDDSDDKFKRTVLQALKPMICQRGPTASPTDVQLQAGDFFTISDYSNLDLQPFIGSEIKVYSIEKIEANTPAGFVWGFKVKENPVTKKARLDRLSKGDASNPLMTAG